jgi:hypothetical protein
MNAEMKIATDERILFCKYGKVHKYKNISRKIRFLSLENSD